MGTFAPVIHSKTLQTMLVLVAINGWDMWQMDIKGTYLNGWLKEEIYMKQPVGFDNRLEQVCLLVRPLYGLKQARNEWNIKFDGTMKDLMYTNT